jgi:6-phosphogluconolactonase
VPDLGADRVWVHALDLPTHRMTQRPDSEGAWVAPPGSGPRRAVLAASGRQVWVLHELTAELQVLDWDAASGTLRTRQTVALSSPGYTGNRSGAELLPSADGRWLYVANRGEHQLLVYRVAPDTSELTLVQRLPSGGQTPWAMATDPSGRWLLVAHQGSGNLALWRIDPHSGQLSDSGERAAVPAPLSLVFQP